MYFDALHDLNPDVISTIEDLAGDLLYGQGGALEQAAGTFITHRMLYATSGGGHKEQGGPASFTPRDEGVEVTHYESIEDILNSGDRATNWRDLERNTHTAQTEWIADVLREIVNGRHEVDNEVRKYVVTIVDRDKLVKFVDDAIESRSTRRQQWLEHFIREPLLPVVMNYRHTAAALETSSKRERKAQQQLMEKAEAAMARVRKSVEERGTLREHYDGDDCDEILDLLEAVAEDPEISDDDIAHFVLLNRTRFDEDVMYLLTTRFPVSQEVEEEDA